MNKGKETLNKVKKVDIPKCGIVMPISKTEGYQSDHWSEIESILKEVSVECGFETRLVSEADGSGLIHSRIIKNIYNDEIIICDVSSKNPNVMFELGLRFAFDKATIIIKDDKTDYSFDTGGIEHLEYPKDLRFNKIIEFKELLKAKLMATFEESKKANYSAFLKNYGSYTINRLQEEEITEWEYVFNKLKDIEKSVKELKIQKDKGLSKAQLAERRIKQLLDIGFSKKDILNIIEERYDAPENWIISQIEEYKTNTKR